MQADPHREARELLGFSVDGGTVAEMNAAALLFAAWSTIETLVFTVNALGFAVDPGGFRNIGKPDELRAIAPRDVLKAKLPGHARTFPHFATAMLARKTALDVLEAQHVVSKHRCATVDGAQTPIDLRALTAATSGLTSEVQGFLLGHAAAAEPWFGLLLDPEPQAPFGTGTTSTGLPIADVTREWRETVYAVLPALRADLAKLSGRPQNP